MNGPLGVSGLSEVAGSIPDTHNFKYGLCLEQGAIHPREDNWVAICLSSSGSD